MAIGAGVGGVDQAEIGQQLQDHNYYRPNMNPADIAAWEMGQERMFVYALHNAIIQMDQDRLNQVRLYFDQLLGLHHIGNINQYLPRNVPAHPVPRFARRG